MSLEESDELSPTDHIAIGISFGNSNSSIAYTTTVLTNPMNCFIVLLRTNMFYQEGKAEVIANEEGGEIVDFSIE